MLQIMNNSTFRFLMLTCIIILSIFLQAKAMPPHPQMLENAKAANVSLPYFITNINAMHAKGICTGHNKYEELFQNAKQSANLTAQVAGQFRILAILVQFSDELSYTPAVFFDSLLFDSNGYTVHDFYNKASYGQLDIMTINLPSSLGWVTAPQTYAYYVNDQNGTGAYPNNTQKLTEDLVDLIDASVDFSNYDNDNNGYVDILAIIHPGQGAEVTGSNADIWSHKWGIVPKLTNDGVYVSNYTIQPEYISTLGDMTIGVFAHEFGHAFGLPDLYDTDYTSNGIGKYGIMGYGSWLGPLGKGGQPALPCAWSRIQLGFNASTNITVNTNSQIINDVKSTGEVYRLWTSGNIGSEYFLVENRQKTGYDSYLPGEGLLVWHIDDAKTDNTQEWYPGLTNSNHFQVALEQADGLYELEHNNDLGDANDVFPGGLAKTSFNAVSSTTSDSYTDGISFVAIENIVLNSGVITADLNVGLAASIEGDNNLPDQFELSQNYPNPFNPSTTISFYTPTNGHVLLQVYNIAGQIVKTLLDEDITAGQNVVQWDGRTDNGDEIASGMYLYRISVNGNSETKKMTLIK